MKPTYQQPLSASRSTVVPSQDGAQSFEATLPGYASARELAAAALPGLSTSKYRVIRLAETEGWSFVDRVGRGGGRLYRISDLPAEAQAALQSRRMDRVVARARRRGRPTGTDYWTRNPEVAAAVEAILAEQKLAAPRVMELLAGTYLQLPSLRSLHRFMARLEVDRVAVIASLRDPDAYKGRHKVAIGRADADCTRAHECWEIDTTKADVMTKGGRKMILGLVDRWSRRAAFMVAPSESGQSVRRFLIQTIRKWGIMPESVMTDNGSGYINAAIISALDTLGIEHRICPPGQPQKKPHIERLFGTFNRERAELLAGYIGHSVSEAQALRAKARKDTGRALIVPEMTPDELQTVLDAWTDGVYHLRIHSSLRMTPMRKWQSSPVPARAAPSEEVLRLALSALVGQRKVGKRGLVWQNGRYWAPALAAWVGRDVIVRRDEDELGELIVFDPDGRFIDIAVDHTRSGMSEAQYARAASEQQAAWMREQRADLKARARDFDIGKAKMAVLRRDAEAAGQLVHFPTPTTAHSTPTIDSLGQAFVSDRSSLPASSPLPETPAPVVQLARTPAQKVREADSIIARAEAGEDIPADVLRRAHTYRTTSEYRVEKMVDDHFSGAAC